MRYFSLGRLCERMGSVPPNAIERALKELGIEPTLELNDLRYWNAEVETVVAEQLLRHAGERIIG